MNSDFQHVLGAMTGTSLDGLDMALARIAGEPPNLQVRLIAHQHTPFPDDLKHALQQATRAEPLPPIHYLRAARRLGQLHADAAQQLIHAHLPPNQPPALLAAHGQTICHAPEEHLSWQLFDPWPIVRTLHIPVVYDLRQADLIAGGQGAPITPIADPILYPFKEAMTFNLGGICNMTHWGRWFSIQGRRFEIDARDLCPCNLLLDGLARKLLNQPCDNLGANARKGRPLRPLRQLIQREIEKAQHNARSLGREQFNDAWLDHLIAQAPDQPPENWLAAACAAIARAIRNEAEGRATPHAILAGGGTKNHTLLRHIRRAPREGIQWHTSAELGIPDEAREALAFAVLGHLAFHKQPLTLPHVTGSTNPPPAGTWAGV